LSQHAAAVLFDEQAATTWRRGTCRVAAPSTSLSIAAWRSG